MDGQDQLKKVTILQKNILGTEKGATVNEDVHVHKFSVNYYAIR